MFNCNRGIFILFFCVKSLCELFYNISMFLYVLQIIRHFDIFQVKPEMTLEKLQLIATAKVSPKHKEQWLRWWNMSKESKHEFNFPLPQCLIQAFGLG